MEQREGKRVEKEDQDDSASNSLESYPITEQIANVFAGSSSVLLLKCIRDRVCRAYLVTIRNIINVPIIFRKHCGAIRDLISDMNSALLLLMLLNDDGTVTQPRPAQTRPDHPTDSI